MLDIDKSGHVNNLSEEQKSSLHQFWVYVMNFLENPESTVPRTRSKKKSDKKLKGTKSGLNSLTLDDDLSTSMSIASMDSGEVQVSDLLDEFWALVGHADPDVLMLRFLRARKWNLEKAQTMLIKCLAWRKKVNLSAVLIKGDSEIHQPSMQCGKAFFYGTDKNSRVIGWIRVKFHNKNHQSNSENEKFIIYQMEMARALLGKDAETASVVFDMTDFSLSCIDNPGIKFLVKCLEAYYPESLGVALVVNAPWIFWGVWKIIKPLLDPVVVAKIKFIKAQEIEEYIDFKYVPKYMRNLISGKGNDESTGFEYKYDEAGKASQYDPEKLASLQTEFDIISREFVANLRENDELLRSNDEEKHSLNCKKREEIKMRLMQKRLEIETLVNAKNFYNRQNFLVGDQTYWEK